MLALALNLRSGGGILLVSSAKRLLRIWGMLHNLQLVRAFAALNVVLFHVIGTSPSYGFPVGGLSVLEGWGSNGVDLFFVLSGFIMFHSQRGKGASWGRFLYMRVIRIVPTYWFLTLLLFFLIAFFPGIFRSGVLDPQLLFFSLFFLSWGALGGTPYLYLGWTLEFEFIFYVIFAVSLLLKRPGQAVYFVAGAFLVLVFGLNITSIFLEFVFGAVLALLTQSRQFSSTVGWAAFLLGAALLAAQIFYPLKEFLPRSVFSGIPATFVVFGMVVLPQRRLGLLGILGDASYSIYLIQVFTIPAYLKLLVLMGVEPSHGELLGVLNLAVTVAGGWLLYALFERPVTQALKNYASRQRVADP